VGYGIYVDGSVVEVVVCGVVEVVVCGKRARVLGNSDGLICKWR